MKLMVRDDRSNEYPSQDFGLDGRDGSLKGRPRRSSSSCWIHLVGRIGPNARDRNRAYCENRTLPGTVWRAKALARFQNPGLPSLEFGIPAERLLSPGEKLPVGQNLVAESVSLRPAVRRAFRSRSR